MDPMNIIEIEEIIRQAAEIGYELEYKSTLEFAIKTMHYTPLQADRFARGAVAEQKELDKEMLRELHTKRTLASTKNHVARFMKRMNELSAQRMMNVAEEKDDLRALMHRFERVMKL